MFDSGELLRVGRDAVAAASVVCRGVQRELDAIRTMTKDDRSPVTVADYAAQAVVCLMLDERLGQFAMIGEEDAGALREQVARGDTLLADAVMESVRRVIPGVSLERVLDAIDMGNSEPNDEGFWTLDPVDGTKGFLRGQQYAVSLAWIANGQVEVGILGCPNLARDHAKGFGHIDTNGSMYTAIKAGGVMESSCTQDAAGSAVTLEPVQTEGLRVCASVEKAHSSQDDTARLLDHISSTHEVEIGEPARLDSQAKYAVVARGQASAYLRLPAKKGYVEKIWDHAAGMLVAREAGALVSDVYGQALDFSKGARLEANTGIVCAGSAYHVMFVDGIKELGLSGDAEGAA